MTDDEIVHLITESNKGMAMETAKSIEFLMARIAGQLHAATVVFRALQYQAGFNRQRFLEGIAVYQTVFEKSKTFAPELRPAFDEYLETICKPL